MISVWFVLSAAALTVQQTDITVRGWQPEWRQSLEYEIALDRYDIVPDVIRLPANQPVRLRFLNNTPGILSFSAPGFFRTALVRSGDERWLENGALRLAPGERREVVLVPAAGRYGARSRNFFHRLLGMSAEIIVE